MLHVKEPVRALVARVTTIFIVVIPETRTSELSIGPHEAVSSGPWEIRTPDLSIANAALYQLS